MKRCPQCNRTYDDDALSFCLDDGSPLVSTSAPSSFDPSATVQYPQSRETLPPPTIAYPGASQYGKTWYQDEEYHMHATKGGFLVMYGPDNKDYRDENATVRVGLRSINSDSPETGYGLTVHGEKKDGKLEDYGFLIINGTNPKYAVVLHKGGKESKVIDWTSSSTIRTGTSPNQIEVRIRDLKMDLYINGQFITSVTDEANYRRGRVGLYTSDVGEVAFDDLEISK